MKEDAQRDAMFSRLSLIMGRDADNDLIIYNEGGSLLTGAEIEVILKYFRILYIENQKNDRIVAVCVD